MEGRFHPRPQLPLTADKYSRIAVVGGYGDDPLICGQGAAEVYTDRAWVDSPLAQLNNNAIASNPAKNRFIRKPSLNFRIPKSMIFQILFSF